MNKSFNSKEHFDEFINENTVKKTFLASRILFSIVLIVSILIFILDYTGAFNNTVLTYISSFTDQSLFYILISISALLLPSKYGEKLRPLIYVFTGIVIFICILSVLSYLQLFGIQNWMHIYCESFIFGMYNMLSYGFLLYATVSKKYTKIAQIIAVIGIVIGYGGLINYLCMYPINAPRIFHYLLYHMILSAAFLIYYPTEEYLKPLVLNTRSSHLGRRVIYSCAVFITIVVLIVVYLKDINYIGYRAPYVAVGAISFIVLLMFFYSNKLSISEIERNYSEENALKLQENMTEIQDLSKVAIVYKEPEGYNWTDEIFIILEIPNPQKSLSEDIILEHTVPEYKEKLLKHYESFTEFNKDYTFINKVQTGKGNIKYLKLIVKFKGDINSFIGFVQDVTENVNTQNELKNTLKNQSILLKEVHHRVKNNLQIILSLLNLEERFNKDNPENVIKQTKSSISSMALIHEQVYQSSDVSHVNANEYFKQSLENLFNLYSTENIDLNLDIDHVDLKMDKSIPLSLIINELALNTIKYAFPNNEKGSFNVILKEIEGVVNIKVFDDGVGVPVDFDFNTSNSLGMSIINNLILQLDADFSRLNDIDGFGVHISFKNN